LPIEAILKKGPYHLQYKNRHPLQTFAILDFKRVRSLTNIIS